MRISVLFAARDSVYKTLPGCDIWDEDRNALTWPGGTPVIAHPPCRAWCRLRTFAKPAIGEKELAPWAVTQVREWGGVLEHPYKSSLWPFCSLPEPGNRDNFGGWTIGIPQWYLGHRAEKATWFYIVGVDPAAVTIPLKLGEPEYVVQTRMRRDGRPEIPKSERSRTPLECALWLISIAQKACVRSAAQ